MEMFLIGISAKRVDSKPFGSRTPSSAYRITWYGTPAARKSPNGFTRLRSSEAVSFWDENAYAIVFREKEPSDRQSLNNIDLVGFCRAYVSCKLPTF